MLIENAYPLLPPTLPEARAGLFGDLLGMLVRHEERARRAINMTPSENILSPMARLPFLLDTYSRYFLDDLRLFGSWFFHGGKELGRLEQEVLLPLLRRLGRAAYVNVRPISGLNCMTVALAALGQPGETIMTVPLEAGGHASTSVVAQRLGLKVHPIPFENAFDVNLDRLEAELSKLKPAIVYIDQSTLLFPIDPAPIRRLIDAASPGTLLHYDSSHVNGLILGGAIFNPLDRGAHTYGGSTHKTLPGPHKGFFATNDEALALKFQATTDHFVSHHHMAEIVSLAITLIEMESCGGAEYACNVITNAREFAHTISESGMEVAAADRGFTGCHQVWAAPDPSQTIAQVAERLDRCGIIVNNFNGLPDLPRPAFRLSLSEATRLGATSEDARTLGNIFADAVRDGASEFELQRRVKALCQKLDRPRYCFEAEDLRRLGAPAKIFEPGEALFESVQR